jgi:hypothetical protein
LPSLRRTLELTQKATKDDDVIAGQGWEALAWFLVGGLFLPACLVLFIRYVWRKTEGRTGNPVKTVWHDGTDEGARMPPAPPFTNL